MITIATDVVRENNQTYRLGWGEQCKDGSRMSVGMPEYVLLFRKPPTDRSDGYADVRVVKSKAEYSRGRWQMDAHAFWRSSGNRLLDPAELIALPADEVFRASATRASHTSTTTSRSCASPRGWTRAPAPAGLHAAPAAVDDRRRVDRRHAHADAEHAAAAKGREMHLCPLQFDIVDRLITATRTPASGLRPVRRACSPSRSARSSWGAAAAGTSSTPSTSPTACGTCATRRRSAPNGGTDAMSNLLTACADCNLGKSTELVPPMRSARTWDGFPVEWMAPDFDDLQVALCDPAFYPELVV
jgi:hypothetical protein